MKSLGLFLLGILFLGSTSLVLAKEPLPAELKNVGITEKIGTSVPLNLRFTNEYGEEVKIGQIFKPNKSVIINLVYFNCPMLCNLVLTGLTEGLKDLPDMPVGEKFEIVSISIDPTDTPATAREYKKKYLSMLGQKNAADHWHFWVGEPSQVELLAKTLGFNYAYNPKTKEYAHAAALFFLTPEAVVARYLYGTEFKPLNLKLALLESRQGKKFFSVERVLLFCYNYDAHSRGYVLYAMNLMKIAAAFTVVILGGFIWRLRKKDKHSQKLNEKDLSREA